MSFECSVNLLNKSKQLEFGAMGLSEDKLFLGDSGELEYFLLGPVYNDFLHYLAKAREQTDWSIAGNIVFRFSFLGQCPGSG